MNPKYSAGQDVVAIDYKGRGSFRSTVKEYIGIKYNQCCYTIIPDQLGDELKAINQDYDPIWVESELRKIDPGSGLTASESFKSLKQYKEGVKL